MHVAPNLFDFRKTFVPTDEYFLPRKGELGRFCGIYALNHVYIRRVDGRQTEADV